MVEHYSKKEILVKIICIVVLIGCGTVLIGIPFHALMDRGASCCRRGGIKR